MLKNKGYYYFSILLLTTIILIIIASGVRYLVNERDTPKIPKIAQDKNASILLKQKGLWVNVVKDFHADKTGKTDSTLAIEKAIKFAQSKKIPLYFPSNGIYKVTHTLNIDISKTALLSNGATLDFRNLADETAIHLYSTVNYNNRFLNTKKALDGIYIIGSIDPVNKLQGKTGLLLGDSKFNSDNFSIEHCAIDGFDNNIRFTDNAWRISFSHIQSRWGSVYAPPGLKNMGENINFEDCMFADALADVQLYTGSFHFSHTSFDNSTLRLGGNATAHVISSHFENPGSRNPTKRFVSIESPDSQVFLTDVDIFTK
ncbi:glycosyl hydrolase family 28-related protein [Terrilactibacillus sp. S3-3]|nr:glycosyl hydrolase family 28-related protein [Terrilactibacillus sp. S3-3]